MRSLLAVADSSSLALKPVECGSEEFQVAQRRPDFDLRFPPGAGRSAKREDQHGQHGRDRRRSGRYGSALGLIDTAHGILFEEV
jgi:hypothetical protein